MREHIKERQTLNDAFGIAMRGIFGASGNLDGRRQASQDSKPFYSGTKCKLPALRECC
jgi:hypothetical protein